MKKTISAALTFALLMTSGANTIFAQQPPAPESSAALNIEYHGKVEPVLARAGILGPNNIRLGVLLLASAATVTSAAITTRYVLANRNLRAQLGKSNAANAKMPGDIADDLIIYQKYENSPVAEAMDKYTETYLKQYEKVNPNAVAQVKMKYAEARQGLINSGFSEKAADEALVKDINIRIPQIRNGSRDALMNAFWDGSNYKWGSDNYDWATYEGPINTKAGIKSMADFNKSVDVVTKEVRAAVDRYDGVYLKEEPLFVFKTESKSVLEKVLVKRLVVVGIIFAAAVTASAANQKYAEIAKMVDHPEIQFAMDAAKNPYHAELFNFIDNMKNPAVKEYVDENFKTVRAVSSSQQAMDSTKAACDVMSKKINFGVPSANKSRRDINAE